VSPRGPRVRLGWLGPALIAVGVAVAALGIWYIRHARPVPGDEIDRVELPTGVHIIVRAEQAGDHAFVEIWDGDDMRWTQFIPHYAGTAQRTGLAWAGNVMSVRVERDGREEVWALGLPDGTKGGSLFLAPEREPIERQLDGSDTAPLTLHDDHRSYELVGGAGWHQVIAIDLATGKALWKHELTGARVDGFTLTGDTLEIAQGASHVRLHAVDGQPG
jgi:hypothetical protein